MLLVGYQFAALGHRSAGTGEVVAHAARPYDSSDIKLPLDTLLVLAAAAWTDATSRRTDPLEGFPPDCAILVQPGADLSTTAPACCPGRAAGAKAATGCQALTACCRSGGGAGLYQRQQPGIWRACAIQFGVAFIPRRWKP